MSYKTIKITIKIVSCGGVNKTYWDSSIALLSLNFKFRYLSGRASATYTGASATYTGASATYTGASATYCGRSENKAKLSLAELGNSEMTLFSDI